MACEDQPDLTNNQTDNSENDSEEGFSSDEQIAFEESVMERLGPYSVDLTEEELEAAFSRVSLAFRCDQFTLCQRLETEEHARDSAEENLKLEVERGMEVLETLKDMCLDVKRAGLLQRLELCLNIIRGTIGRISNTAEVLGAVHQEAKVSRAVELMVAHVENLKHRQERNCVELEEMKKQMEKSSRERYVCELREEIDAIEKLEKDSQKPQLRRRISANVIAKKQKVKELDAVLSSVNNEIRERRESNTKKPEDSDECLLMERRNTSSPSVSHQRPRKKASLERSQTWVKKSERCLQRPLLQWMYHCRWIVLVIYLTVLCSIIILAILVWLLQTPVLWM